MRDFNWYKTDQRYKPPGFKQITLRDLRIHTDKIKKILKLNINSDLFYINIYISIDCYEENYHDQFFEAFNSACSSWQDLGKVGSLKAGREAFYCGEGINDDEKN